VAIIFSIPWQKTVNNRANKGSWFYLLIVFLGFGVIDVLLKQITKINKVPFTSAIFVIFILAFILSMLRLIYQWSPKNTAFHGRIF